MSIRTSLVSAVNAGLLKLGLQINRVKQPYDLGTYADSYAAELLQAKPFYNVGAGSFWHPYWTNIDYVSDWYKDVQKEVLHYDLMSNDPLPIKTDSALRVAMDVDAVAVVVVPGASKLAIDSLAKVIAPVRRDSTVLIVALGYRGVLIPELKKVSLDEEQRLATLRMVIQRLNPDIVLPAEDPYGSGERVLGSLSPDRWKAFLTRAARVAKETNKNVRVGVAASSYTRNDSTLYAWAASPGSPIDVVGFSLFPSPYVGGGIQADTRTADRWMRATPPKKEHWIFATGGYPLAYGERSQENAVWEVLAWGTDHPAIKGAVVYEAGDYGVARGLRAPNGRLRPVTRRVVAAIEQLRESAR